MLKNLVYLNLDCGKFVPLYYTVARKYIGYIDPVSSPFLSGLFIAIPLEPQPPLLSSMLNTEWFREDPPYISASEGYEMQWLIDKSEYPKLSSKYIVEWRLPYGNGTQ